MLIKKCPNCDAMNPSTNHVCEKCGTRLDGVKLQRSKDLEQPFVNKKDSNSDNNNNVGIRYGRRCNRCGKMWEMSQITCSDCNITTTPVQMTAHPVFTLRFDDEQTTIQLTEGETLQIQRKDVHTSNPLEEYLYERLYVSHQDAKVFCKDKKLYIVRDDLRNPTVVNNEKIGNYQPRELKGGDEVVLGYSPSMTNEPHKKKAAYFKIEKEEG